MELIFHSCFLPIVNPLHLTVCCSFNFLHLPPRTFSLSRPYFYALKPLPPSPCRVVQFFTASLVVLMTLSPLSSFFSFSHPSDWLLSSYLSTDCICLSVQLSMCCHLLFMNLLQIEKKERIKIHLHHEEDPFCLNVCAFVFCSALHW